MPASLHTPLEPPDDPVPYVGRYEEELGLFKLLDRDLRRPEILVLHGSSGVGKSALAARVARRSGRMLNLPLCWVPPQDPRTPAAREALLLRMLGRLGGSRQELASWHEEFPAGIEGARDREKALLRLCRDHLRARPALVILDDLPYTGRGQHLIDAFRDTGCVTVVTSVKNDWPEVLDGACLHEVRPLDAATDATLLRRTADVHGRTLDEAAARSWCHAAQTQGHPLHTRIAGALAAALPPGAPAPAERTPERFLAAARARLGKQVIRQLETLASHPLLEFSDPVNPVLRDAEFVQQVRPGRFTLHPALRSGLWPHVTSRGGHPGHRPLPDLDAVEKTGFPLSSDSPPTGDQLDDWINLITHPATQGPPCGEAAWRLARHLVVRADHHRLLALDALLRKDRFFPVALALAARGTGRIDRAAAMLRDSYEATDQVQELAVTLGQLGCPRKGLAVLDRSLTGPLEPDGWHLQIKGSLLTDMGLHSKARTALDGALADHDRWATDRRRLWARFHSARLDLLVGRNPERALREVESGFLWIQDVHGAAHALTERGRLARLTKSPRRAAAILGKALAEHTANEDPRGMAWTLHHRGLARPLSLARIDLAAALRLFEKLPDLLGTAWTHHQLGTTLLRTDDRNAAEHLRRAWELFLEAECPYGAGWTALELHLLPGSSRPFLLRAQEAFEEIEDANGLKWVELVHYGRDTLPRHARDTITPEHPDGSRLPDNPCSLDEPLPADECRISLTLLDDSPAPDSSARVLLRVEPGAAHPWALTDAPPWLTAVAVPLTRAGLEPETAPVRPSAAEAHGAEFRFTPHRPGLHRLRFTLVHTATGAVLLQVETEIDIPPGESAAAAALSPYPRSIGRR